MYKNKKIGVIVRAFNEENFVASVVNAIPDFVDRIYVVNDASTDRTKEILFSISKKENRLMAINHPVRGGAGAAALSGYKKALEENLDIVATVDGDGQMIPAILNGFIEPLVSQEADFTKGNRLYQRELRTEMPPWRIFGNFLLTYLTRISSGYWHIYDPQNGYTAISVDMLRKLNLGKINKGFAFENDMLVNLNVLDAKVMNIPHYAVYKGQQSKIRYHSFILQTSWLLIKDFFWRIYAKYIRGKSNIRPMKGHENTIYY